MCCGVGHLGSINLGKNSAFWLSSNSSNTEVDPSTCEVMAFIYRYGSPSRRCMPDLYCPDLGAVHVHAHHDVRHVHHDVQHVHHDVHHVNHVHHDVHHVNHIHHDVHHSVHHVHRPEPEIYVREPAPHLAVWDRPVRIGIERDSWHQQALYNLRASVGRVGAFCRLGSRTPCHLDTGLNHWNPVTSYRAL